MPIEIKVPSLGESVSEATISRIIKTSGSLVHQNDEIIELETDKVNQVLYASQSGQLSLMVKVGDKVRVGQSIGSIDTNIVMEQLKNESTPISSKAAESSLSKSSKVPTTPVRKMAQESIQSLKDPQPSLEVQSQPESNVSLIKSSSNSEGKGQRSKMSSLRKTIAQKLVEVKNTTAMLTTFNEVDMTKVIEIRTKEQENFLKKYGIKLGFMPFFIKASVAALKAFPQVHSYMDQDDIVLFPHFDLGVAVSTEKGLMVPVIRQCDTASFGTIETQLSELAKKARQSTITLDELRGGCFTITNGGTFGSLLSTPILNPPQSAILGMHAIIKRPIAIEDQVVIRPMMYLALSYDHRIIDGKDSVQFLMHIKQSIEDPSRLLLDL